MSTSIVRVYLPSGSGLDHHCTQTGRPSSFRRSSSSMQACSSPFWMASMARCTRSCVSGVGATSDSPSVPRTSSGLSPSRLIAARLAMTKRESVSS